MQLAVLAGDRWMGEEFTVRRFPRVTIRAKGTATLDRVEVLLDGKKVDTLVLGEAREIETSWEPKSTITGSHYLYFRIVQSDGNRAWSSPLFVHVSR